MATIVLRSVKGSKLTHAEADANFNNLNEQKLEAGVLNAASTILTRDKDNNLVAVVIAEGQIIGRLVDGSIKGLSIAEAKTLLAVAITDVTGLEAALALKATEADLTLVEDDVADLQTDVADLEAALNGMSIFAQGTDTLAAGTKAVTVALMLATDRVVVGVVTPGGTQGALFTTGAEAGGFTCKSTDIADTSTFFYIVFRP